MTTIHRPLAAVAFAASLMIALAGCGSNGTGSTAPAASQAKVFQFESAGFSSPKALAIKLPQSLLDAMGNQQGLVVTGYDLTVREMPGAEYCAFDLKMTYADGGKELAGKPVLPSRTPDQSATVQKNLIKDAVAAGMKQAKEYGYTGSSVNEGFTKAFGPASTGVSSFLHQWVGNNSESVDLMLSENVFNNWPGTYEDAFAKIDKRIDDDAAKANAKLNSIPAPVNVAKRLLDDSEGKPASELPASPTGLGAYVADDLASGTVVRRCATQPYDDQVAAETELTFPMVVDGKEDTLARAYVTVMKGGDLTVRDSKVDGYTFGSDGRWIKK